MRQAFSLLLGPLSRQARPPQQILVWPTPADQSVPDQPPLVQYTFRRGGFYKLLNRPLLYPDPADQSIPNQPVVPQYTFRPGGYWQPQKALLFPAPADQSVPDQQIVPQYVFRKGRLWQIQKSPPVPPAVPDVVVAAAQSAGGDLADWLHFSQRRRERQAYEDSLLLALTAGILTFEEYALLLSL